ncbi:hypothetical protein JCM10449v2_000972 [Rhodotorula kratochvilovae]
MGFFSSSSSNAPPPVPDKHDMDKDEVIRSLTRELVETRQRNQELEQSYRIAVGARRAACDKVRELEDVLRLKDGIFESLERQVSLLEKQNTALQLKEAELATLRMEMEEHPVCESDLKHRYDQLVDIFDNIKDTLSCAVCYEPYGRDEAVSLMCGHTFCKSCYKTWEERHVEAFKLSPRSGQYIGPECPECRLADGRRGRIRVWSLEEVVRLVDRATREIAGKPYVPKVDPPRPVSAKELVEREDRLVDVDDGGEGLAQDLPPTPVSEGTPAPVLDAAEPPEAVLMDVEAPQLPDNPSNALEASAGRLDASAAAASGDLPFTDGAVEPAAPASASAGVFEISDTLSRQMLDAHARAREEARLRAQEAEALAAEEARRVRDEEEEREAREAREQVMYERARTPYVQVFR